MTKLWNVLAVLASTLPFVAAAQQGAAPAAERSEHEQHAAASGEDAAGEQPTAAMHEHMRDMREQMARIQATEDAGERERLMHEHMQSMQQHMQMMGSMRAGQRAANPSRCTEGDAACRMDEMRAENGMMGQRVGVLEDRLASIEGLLQQLIEHQRAEEAQNAGTRRERRR